MAARPRSAGTELGEDETQKLNSNIPRSRARCQNVGNLISLWDYEWNEASFPLTAFALECLCRDFCTGIIQNWFGQNKLRNLLHSLTACQLGARAEAWKTRNVIVLQKKKKWKADPHETSASFRIVASKRETQAAPLWRGAAWSCLEATIPKRVPRQKKESPQTLKNRRRPRWERWRCGEGENT